MDNQPSKLTRFNSYVDSVIQEEEGRERFYRDAKHNSWYRSVVSKMLDRYINDLVKEEEATFGTDSHVSTVAQRLAARRLQALLTIGDK